MNASARWAPAPAEDTPPIVDTRSIVVSVEAVAKTFKAGRQETQALGDVSLTVRSGEFLSLVGRSGSGKSTLLRLIAGLLAPTEGRVVVDGRVVDGPPVSARYVFQDYSESLFPWLSARDNVAFGARSAGDDRRAALRAADHFLDLVGLQIAASRYPWELSGGMQQRLAIARALACKPQVLVADEAVSALDVSVQAQIMALLREIQSELGLGLLFITHDLRVAAQLCDRVIVMHQGRIVEEGLTAELYANPQQDYTRRLFEAAPGHDFAQHLRD